jgi:hypothetical protein
MPLTLNQVVIWSSSLGCHSDFQSLFNSNFCWEIHHLCMSGDSDTGKLSLRNLHFSFYEAGYAISNYTRNVA